MCYSLRDFIEKRPLGGYDRETKGNAIKNQKGFLRHFIIAILIIIVCLIAVSYVRGITTRTIAEMRATVLNTHEAIGQTRALQTTFQEVMLAERGYLLSGKERHLRTVTEKVQQLKEQISELLFSYSSRYRYLLIQFSEGFDILFEEQITPLLKLHDPTTPTTLEEEVRIATLMDESQILTDALDGFINEFEAAQLAHLAELSEREELLIRRDTFYSIFGPLVVVIIALFSGTYAVIRLERYRRQQIHDQAAILHAHSWLSAVIDGSDLGTWRWDISTGEITINHKLAEMIGYTKEELTPFTFEKYYKLTHSEDYVRSQQIIVDLFSTQKDSYSYDLRLRHKGGHWIWAMVRGKVTEWDAEGNPLILLGTQTDITERVLTAELVVEQEEESSKLLRAMTQGFAYSQLVLDEQGNPKDFILLRVNESFEKQVGRSAEELLNRPASETLLGIESEWLTNNGYVALTGKPMVFESYNAHTDRFYRVSSYSPQVGYFANIIEDLSPEYVLRDRLAEEKNFFEATLLNIADGVITTDAKGAVRFMNGRAEELIGWSPIEVQGRPLSEILRTTDGPGGPFLPSPYERITSGMDQCVTKENTILVSRDGVERYIGGRTSAIYDEEKELQGVVIVLRDITEEHRKQEQIVALSHTDPLTTLSNRRFYELQRVALDTEASYPLAIIIADLNGLKITNDAFGHEAGDELLQTVAAVLKGLKITDGTCARIGGDEFVLLLPKTTAEEAEAIVGRIDDDLKKRQVRNIPVSVSLGYAIKESSEQHFEQIFKRAEDAMYQNKFAINSRYKQSVINSLVDRLFEREPQLRDHSQRAGELAAALGTALYLSPTDVAQLRQAGYYHDLGCIAIGLSVLYKAEEDWTKAERIEMRRVPEIGHNILSSRSENSFIAKAILHHKERWDGSGYPQKLKGNAIPISSQILGLSTFYLNSLEVLGGDGAILALENSSGSYFDPLLVSIFFDQVLGRGKEAW